MATSKQEQSVEDGGQAIQSARDTNVNSHNTIINNGMSLELMEEFFRRIAQLENYTKEALAEIDGRNEEFKEAILTRFADPSRTNGDAFRDPDFQGALGDAQRAYARSGDEAVLETLADIIAQRSMATSASREALTLNDAAARAPRLTKAEFAALSLCYLLKYTVATKVYSAETMAEYINKELIPLAKEVSREQSSFWHIEAQSCGTISIGSVGIDEVLTRTYPGLLGEGLLVEDLQAKFPSNSTRKLDDILCPSVRNVAKVQPKAVTMAIFLEKYGTFGFDEKELTAIWEEFEGTIPNKLADLLRPLSPEIDELYDLWDSTPLKSLQLNSVGIAIGHANAVRVVGVDAPLSIWIR